MNRKTKSQREAINKRAAAYPRPISPLQRSALAGMCSLMPSFSLYRSDQGAAFSDVDTGKSWPSQTILSLVARGLCNIRAGRFASITAAGRRELARHRGAS